MDLSEGIALDPKPGREASRESRVEAIDSWPTFQALAAEWDDLAERVGGEFFSRHGFIANWLAHFASDRFLVLALWDAYGRLTAVLPLVRRRSVIYGVPVRQWHSASNCHSGRFDLLADDPPNAAWTLIRHLAARKDWDVVVLSELGGRAAALELLDAARGAQLSTGRWWAPDSPVLELPSQWSELERGLSGSFRANLRRKRRLLMKAGRVTARRFDDDLRVLTEGMALEARGWKGRRGTAMIQHSSTRDFYTNLATRTARDGALAVWALRVDDRMVAFQYGIEFGGAYHLLKLAYDEEFARCSPGQLLMEDVLRDAVDRRLERFDFLGDSMPWKEAWRPLGQQRAWLYLFRDAPLPRAAHTLKFRLAPALRRSMGRA